MKITLITVGKIKEKYLKDAITEYSKRLSRYCKLEIIEVADEKTPDNASETVEDGIRDKEGERILKYVRDDAYVVTLEIEGKLLTSEELAKKIENLGIQGTSHIIFIIGGSIGLGKEVLKRSDYALSFSKMTFPHQLMRVILLEQIYRSYRIISHEPFLFSIRLAFAFVLTGSSAILPSFLARQRLFHGHCSHNGAPFGTHTVAPSSISAWLKAPGISIPCMTSRSSFSRRVRKDGFIISV